MNAKRRTNFAAAADRQTPPAAAPAPAPAPPGTGGKAVRAPRTKPVRVTLDLAPAQHRALKAWCNQAALDGQLPTVNLAHVFRILGDLLLNESDVTERVQTRLEAGDGGT
jgi:hypothetical protein